MKTVVHDGREFRVEVVEDESKDQFVIVHKKGITPDMSNHEAEIHVHRHGILWLEITAPDCDFVPGRRNDGSSKSQPSFVIRRVG